MRRYTHGAPIVPTQWTLFGRYAVRTRSIFRAALIASSLQARRDAREHGRCRRTDFMTAALFRRELGEE